MLRRPRFAWLIAALLLVQWGVAFAHVPAAPAHLLMDICGADGSVTRVAMPLGEDGSDGQDPGEASPVHCPLCTAPTALGLPPAPPGITLPLTLAQTADPLAPPAQSPAPMPCCRPQPRAPPTA
jgi:hypothetical protein